MRREVWRQTQVESTKSILLYPSLTPPMEQNRRISHLPIRQPHTHPKQHTEEYLELTCNMPRRNPGSTSLNSDIDWSCADSHTGFDIFQHLPLFNQGDSNYGFRFLSPLLNLMLCCIIWISVGIKPIAMTWSSRVVYLYAVFLFIL